MTKHKLENYERFISITAIGGQKLISDSWIG